MLLMAVLAVFVLGKPAEGPKHELVSRFLEEKRASRRPTSLAVAVFVAARWKDSRLSDRSNLCVVHVAVRV